MTTPEAHARRHIDELLRAAGWGLQDRAQLNLSAARGVAVREFALKTGFADYLLFVDRKAIGAIEAKAVGTTLSGVEAQSEKYSSGLPDVPPAWRKPLPFLYESTGIETFFTDGRDPEPRSRRVFAFHQPEMLARWVQEPAGLRGRLRSLPPLITDGRTQDSPLLWPAQVEAITNLEQSFAADRPRALIQMATGSGKTFTAVTFIYRLIKHGDARRVLFLVDRGNLGRQTLREFQQFITPDDGRKFTEIYNVQHLQSNALDPVARVCITTIQRLYAMLCGQELDAELEERSLSELEGLLGMAPREVQYNPGIPVEFFDMIVTDECHRSIYNLWRQVLEYFDAHLVGLTATPSKQTLGFFNRNLVMEYGRQRAVVDGVNVDGEVYRIRTAITQGGSTVEAGYSVERRDRKTRARRWEELDEDFTYTARQLYSRPYSSRRLSFQQVKELAARLEQPPLSLTTDALWRAYAQLERDRVRGLGGRRVLADMVALIRHAVQGDGELAPYPEQVQARYARWLAQQEDQGRMFTAEQRWWLDRIAEQIGVNLSVGPDDFDNGELFNRGGRYGAMRALGQDWLALVEELNTELAA